MRKIFYILIILFLIFLLLGPAGSQSAQVSKNPLRVVCTILPVYVLTLNVVNHTPGIEVKLLLPPHQGCPHDYDLTPRDLIKLSRADLIIANGLGMETFIEKTLDQTNLKSRILIAAQKVKPIDNRTILETWTYENQTREKGHYHEDSVNGHTWASPKSGAAMVETIADGLGRFDPLHKQIYQSNSRSYARKLELIAQEMKNWVSGAKNKKCLILHNSLVYLARDIGLSLIGVIEAHSGLDPSPKEMAVLITKLKKEKVAAIFSEPQYSDKIVKSLSRETGVPYFELDPVATGEPAAETYEKAMRKNLKILQRAIK